MGPCIVCIFQYISNKMQRYTVYLYLETALHVSGGTSTHHQERIQLYLQHLVFITPLLLSVEQFPDINKLCNVASCWIYIGILLGVHYILHISRIRVKVLTRITGTLNENLYTFVTLSRRILLRVRKFSNGLVE